MSSRFGSKNTSVGFYLSAASIVFAVIALIMFFTVDPTFSGFLRATYVTPYIVFLALGVIASASLMFVPFLALERNAIATAACHLIAVVFGMLALVNMCQSGVYETAMALGSMLGDHARAYFFVAVIIVQLISVIFSMSSAFCRMRKQG